MQSNYSEIFLSLKVSSYSSSSWHHQVTLSVIIAACGIISALIGTYSSLSKIVQNESHWDLHQCFSADILPFLNYYDDNKTLFSPEPYVARFKFFFYYWLHIHRKLNWIEGQRWNIHDYIVCIYCWLAPPWLHNYLVLN